MLIALCSRGQNDRYRGKLYDPGNVIIAMLVGAFLLLSAPQSHAQELKIGFVNAARVLENAPQADAARRKLEQEFSPRDKKLIASQQTIRDMEEKLTRDGAIMSEDERRKFERDLMSRKRDLKREQDEFREDLNIRRNESFDKLRRRVFEVIVDIAKSENFDLIVSDGVVFASDKIDITGKVVDRLKKEFESPPGK